MDEKADDNDREMARERNLWKQIKQSSRPRWRKKSNLPLLQRSEGGAVNDCKEN